VIWYQKDTISKDRLYKGKRYFMKKGAYDCHAACSVEAALDVIGGKWKGVIVYHLLSGTKRFNELHRSFQGITHRMLVLQLQELEKDGVIHRQVYPEVPPKVEYSLTPFGQSLQPILLLIREWGEEYTETLTETKQVSQVLD
jgi:DNA-binding HxlR family transcriptional regulator